MGRQARALRAQRRQRLTGLSAQVLEPAASERLRAVSGGLPRNSNLLLARAAGINAPPKARKNSAPWIVPNALKTEPCVSGLHGTLLRPNPQP